MGARAAKKARQRSRAARKRRLNLMLLAAGAALASVAALIVIGGALRNGGAAATHASQRAGRTLGSETALVVLTAWEDFQCPVCKAANQSVLAEIERNYVDSGKVQLQYRHFAFLGQESIWAAEAAECAAEQHMFWEYHDALFKAQAGENRGAFSKVKLGGVAAAVGLDRTSFDECLASDRYRAAIENERREGEALGVAATPTFFVDGKAVADWRSYDDFAALIERALDGR